MHSVWSWLVITGKCGEVNACRTETCEGGVRNKHGHKTTSLSLMASQILRISSRYPPRCRSIYSSQHIHVQKTDMGLVSGVWLYS